MKDNIKIILRWILLLPASIIGSYLAYIIFYLINTYTPFRGSHYTNIDKLWDYSIMFVSHIFMGMAFIGIGVYIAPSHKKACSCVLFAITCIMAGVLLTTIILNFSWVSLISTICSLCGASYIFYICVNEDDCKIDKTNT